MKGNEPLLPPPPANPPPPPLSSRGCIRSFLSFLTQGPGHALGLVGPGGVQEREALLVEGLALQNHEGGVEHKLLQAAGGRAADIPTHPNGAGSFF